MGLFQFSAKKKLKKLAEQLYNITKSESFNEFVENEEYNDVLAIHSLKHTIFSQDFILPPDILTKIKELTKKLPSSVAGCKRLGRYIVEKGNTKNTDYYDQIFKVMSLNKQYTGKAVNNINKEEMQCALLSDMILEESEMNIELISQYGAGVFNVYLFKDDLINEVQQLKQIKQNIWSKYELGKVY